MDKKFLKENNLLEAQRHFMRLCEWSYVPSTLEEDEPNQEDEAIPNDPNANQMPPQDNMGGDASMPPMEGPNAQDPMGQGDPNMPPQNGPMDQDPMNQDPMQGGEEDPNSLPPIEDDPMMDDELEGEDEEVIDVDDLTQAQEKVNDKVNLVGQDLGQVDSKISQLLSTLAKMEQMIDNNNQEIQNFKQEFEKRNPTQTEKLNLRSLDSYPFNISPKDYWAEKGMDPNSNYSAYADNQQPTTQEYQITNNDVDDFDERSIERSFDIDDDLQQDLRKIFGF